MATTELGNGEPGSGGDGLRDGGDLGTAKMAAGWKTEKTVAS